MMQYRPFKECLELENEVVLEGLNFAKSPIFRYYIKCNRRC